MRPIACIDNMTATCHGGISSTADSYQIVWAARRDNDSRRRPMDICDTISAKRSGPPACLTSGRRERGLCSPAKPMRMQGDTPEPGPPVSTASVFDCGSFRAILKVYGSLFLAFIAVNTILYERRLAALAPLLVFIIGPDGTSNNVLYLRHGGGLSPIFANGRANLSRQQPGRR
jgi:hypothetical protein